MKKVCLALLLVLLSYSSYSSEAFFRPVERQVKDLTEGDSFKGVIELWNITNVSPEMIYELKNKVFLKSFYVVSLEQPRWSENNPEVVVIEGMFILVKAIKENKQLWKLGGVEIDVTIKELETKGFTAQKKGFAILEGNYDLEKAVDYTLPLILFVILALLLTAVFLYRKKMKKVVLVKDSEVDWDVLFKKAKSREDFSKIYENRDLWIEKLGTRKSVSHDFIKNAETLLFKQETQDYELEELKVSSESIVKELGK